jgi:hypothetical protein
MSSPGSGNKVPARPNRSRTPTSKPDQSLGHTWVRGPCAWSRTVAAPRRLRLASLRSRRSPPSRRPRRAVGIRQRAGNGRTPCSRARLPQRTAIQRSADGSQRHVPHANPPVVSANIGKHRKENLSETDLTGHFVLGVVPSGADGPGPTDWGPGDLPEWTVRIDGPIPPGPLALQLRLLLASRSGRRPYRRLDRARRRGLAGSKDSVRRWFRRRASSPVIQTSNYF